MEPTKVYKLEEVNNIYLDLKYFFDTNETSYLTAIIPPKDILAIMESLERIFSQNQQFEKCKKLRDWKFIINSLYMYNGE